MISHTIFQISPLAQINAIKILHSPTPKLIQFTKIAIPRAWLYSIPKWNKASEITITEMRKWVTIITIRQMIST